MNFVSSPTLINLLYAIPSPPEPYPLATQGHELNLIFLPSLPSYFFCFYLLCCPFLPMCYFLTYCLPAPSLIFYTLLCSVTLQPGSANHLSQKHLSACFWLGSANEGTRRNLGDRKRREVTSFLFPVPASITLNNRAQGRSSPSIQLPSSAL